MPTSSISVQVDDIACIIPETQLRDYLLKSGITKVNDFEVRPGFDFCEGHFILTSSDVDSLDPQNVSITYRETRTDPQPDVEVKFDNLIIAETSLLLTPVEEPNTLLLVKIVDQRYYSVKNLVGISHSLFPSTRGCSHVDAKNTWQEIFDDYWSNTSNSLPLSHDKAVYPTSVMRDVHFNEPISSLRVMTRVLSMLSHSIYVTRTGGSTGYEIAPLFLQAGANTTLLSLNDSIAREIQKKNDNNVDGVRRPNEHTVVFRNDGVNTSENSIAIQDPNPISNFSRTTSIFSQRDDAAADQIFADDISSLMFSSYETFNLNNRVYFGLMDFEHSADCSTIHFYFDVVSNSLKTKIKSHNVQSSFQAQSDFGDPLLKFRLLEDLPVCGTAQIEILDEDCNRLKTGVAEDVVGLAILDEMNGVEFCRAGSMGFVRPSESGYNIISIGIGTCCNSSSESSESSESESSLSSDSSSNSSLSSESSVSSESSNESSSLSESLESSESLSSSSDSSSSESSSSSSESESSNSSSESSESLESETASETSSDPSSDSDSSDGGCEFPEFSVCIDEENTTIEGLEIAFERQGVFTDANGEMTTNWDLLLTDGESFFSLIVQVPCDTQHCDSVIILGNEFSPPLSTTGTGGVVTILYGNDNCCGLDSSSSSSESEVSSSSSSSSSESEDCFMPFDIESLPIFRASEIDGLLAMQNGCLGLVPVRECNLGSSESSE